MKRPKSTLPTVLYALAALLVVNCASSPKLQEKAPIQFSKAYFHEWISDIKIGSEGVDIHFANLVIDPTIKIDSVYFRNLKGKLTKDKGKYVSQLIKRLPINEGHTLMNKGDFPFELQPNECVVSYQDQGETKYVKFSNLIEKQGIYQGATSDVADDY